MYKRLFVYLLAFAFIGGVAAKPVGKGTAAQIASKVLQKAVSDATPDSFAECYLFVATDGKGFVLLSADDCVFPLLGYSMESPFPTDEMPEHLVSWIDGYQREIASVKAIGGWVSDEVRNAWERLLKGTVAKTDIVGPLLETRWSQKRPYNMRCPYDSTRNVSTVTGCMATATAQVMRYWRHPAQGRGYHAYYLPRFDTIAVNYDTSFYDWDNMPAEVHVFNPQEEIDAVAKLCFEVGASMDMSYSASASGAYEHSGGMLKRRSAELSLENHFGYNPAMYTAFKESYSDEEWAALMRSELDEGRPLIYTGSSSSGGHAFVIDGYDNQGLFHVNWGWGDSYLGNYTISHLAVGQEGSSSYMAFNEMNNAIVRMYPATPNDSVSVVNVVSSNSLQGTVRGSGTYPVDCDRVMLYATANDGYRFDHWASGNTANPIFYYPTMDYSDTAYFVSLSNDTLGYSHHFAPNFDTIYSLGHCEWGIRIPAAHVPEGRRLEKVMNFIYTTGRYVMRIYQGEMPGIPVYEDTLSLRSYGWRTIAIESPLVLDGSQPLWITFVTENVKYPAGICPNTGVDDGSWIKHDGVWELMDTNLMGYYTWSILGILDGNNAVEEAVDDGLRYSVDGLSLTVTNSERRAVALYDIQGRLLATLNTQSSTLRLPATGVYILQAAGMKAHRVVAIDK